MKRRMFISKGLKTALLLSLPFANKLKGNTRMPDFLKSASMNNKDQNANTTRILIAYSSRYGSTADVAKAIGKVLEKHGNMVDIKNVEDSIEIKGYDSIVIGSAINYDHWMPEAHNFLLKNEAYLSEIPVAYFFTCLVLSQKTDKTLRKAEGYADKIRQLSSKVNPISVQEFAGALNYKKMSFFHRTIMKSVMAVIGVKEGDYRDWKAIESWANSLKKSQY